MTELFEKYYQNKLSSSERLGFDQKLKSDNEFAQDYDAYVMMMDFMGSKDDVNSALNNLNEVHEELKREEPSGNKKKPTIFRFFRSPIAAVFVLFMGFAVFYFYTTLSNKIDSPQELFATHFLPAPVSLTTKGGDIELLLAQIDSDYKDNNYKAVINNLNQVNIDSLDVKNRLYLMLASSYLSTNSFPQSRDALKSLEAIPQFINEYYWYSGLSYLGEGNLEDAKNVLKKIPKSSNYFERAKSILEN